MNEADKHPALEERFTQPEGWRWHEFARNDRTIRFGSVFPKDSIPDAVVVCLQGVREFSEKYFETARWCLDNNLAFWTCDWVGQGKSTRYLANRQKRHNLSFQEDVEDLQYFILQYIKHSSVHPDKGRIPLALLAHSMGANIGMHHLNKYPGTFECAAFTAPMIGIKVFENIPNPLSYTASAICSLLLGTSYVPGGKDWGKRKEHVTLTSDPVRAEIMTQWNKADTDLNCGDVTFRWVHEAHKSCIILQKPIATQQIKTHCLFGIPGHEELVDNKKARKVIAGIENAKTIEYPDAYHEILMEKNETRNDFLNHFYKLIRETIIERPETLKPF